MVSPKHTCDAYRMIFATRPRSDSPPLAAAALISGAVQGVVGVAITSQLLSARRKNEVPRVRSRCAAR